MGSHSHADDKHAVAEAAAKCDCVAHRHVTATTTTTATTPSKGLGWLSGLLPILACALCPLCLSAYATLLSALGVGFALSEGQHRILLLGAVVAALISGGWRAYMTRRYGPLALSVLGCAALLFADFLHESRALSLLGMLFLVAAMLWDRWSVRRSLAAASPGH